VLLPFEVWLFRLLSALGMFPSAVVIQDDDRWFQGDELSLQGDEE